MARTAFILLAALIGMSSSGLVFHQHYCQGELRSQALYLTPENCHAKNTKAGADAPVCPFHAAPSGESEGEKGCCDDHSTVLKLDIPQWHLAKSDLPSLIPFLPAPAVSFSYADPSIIFLRMRSATGWAFDLPPPKYGLQALLQVFRN